MKEVTEQGAYLQLAQLCARAEHCQYELQEKMRRIKPYRNKMENRHQWCIAAVPGRAWARRVFPAAAGRPAIRTIIFLMPRPA